MIDFQNQPEETPTIRDQNRTLTNSSVKALATEVFENKLKFLLKKMDAETDLNQIKALLDLIERI